MTINLTNPSYNGQPASSIQFNADALCELGRSLMFGEDGTPIDKALAYSFFQAALKIDQTKTTALTHIAQLYYTGTNGSDKDIEMSLKLYTKALESSTNESLNQYIRKAISCIDAKMKADQLKQKGLLYLSGSATCPKHPKRAYKNLYRAFQYTLYDPVVLAHLGEFHLIGEHVRKDVRQAYTYLFAAYELDPKNICALRCLGDIYRDGLGGIPKDLQHASTLHLDALILAKEKPLIAYLQASLAAIKEWLQYPESPIHRRSLTPPETQTEVAAGAAL